VDADKHLETFCVFQTVVAEFCGKNIRTAVSCENTTKLHFRSSHELLQHCMASLGIVEAADMDSETSLTAIRPSQATDALMIKI
jgi:hypothetical protein